MSDEPRLRIPLSVVALGLVLSLVVMAIGGLV